MNIWRVDVKKQTVVQEAVPEHWQTLGGRGLLAQIMVDEVEPTCDPLGPQNKLIFAPGLLVGHRLSSCDRISVGGKSPLTGGIKESNAGGSTGLALTHLGIKALIIEGQPVGMGNTEFGMGNVDSTPHSGGWWILYLSKTGARWERADELAGKGVFETAEALLAQYGDKVAISLIGPGGEMGLAGAGIQNLDKDKTPSRINARGGLGAVMGSKGLKAIIFDNEGCKKPPIVDEKAYKAAQKYFVKELMEQSQTKTYSDYGTAAMTNLTTAYGALPTRNFSQGRFEDVEKISGETMRDLLLARGGESETTHACMAGCTIRCSNIFGGEDGQEIVSPLEYETIGLMGSNLGINSLDMIARMNWQVNDMGLDSIEIGAALGVAAEAGLMAWGDGGRALELLDEIRAGSELGRLLGNGAVAIGKAYGVERVPAVKGQAMSAYDPRAIKGTGITYATSPQGADHTCGLTIRANIDHLDPLIQHDLSRNAQYNMAGYDTLGACSFAGFGFAAAPGSIRDLLNARYGWEVPDTILQDLGKQTIRLEKEFNRRAGFTADDDRLPAWMAREPLEPTNAVFDVPEAILDSLFKELLAGKG
jgi:aldehyde:ferredoxin oxidoreductase